MSNMFDWSKIEQYPKQTIECRCGAVFRAHARYSLIEGSVVTKEPCPGCGSFNTVRAARSDPEVWSVGGE